jgi:hypothetical protein
VPKGAVTVSVRAEIELRLVLGGDRAVTVPSTLGYAPSDPYAISATFRTSDGDVTWVFGRDLIEDGLRMPSGEGDVAVWPSISDGRGVVCLSLDSPSGSALLEADLHAMRAFLDASYDLVPMGQESGHLDLDETLARLLGDESADTA